MDKIRPVYILLPVLGLVSLCGLCGFSVFRFVFPPRPPRTPTPPPPHWFTEWLIDPVCQPPCWQGITPGMTTMTETVQILQGLPGVYIDEIPEMPIGKFDDQLSWDYSTPSEGGGIAFVSKNGVIEHFFLGGVLSTRLEKVIESYGMPSHVFIPSCSHGMCDTRLIYMTNGMVVDLFLDWDPDEEGDATITADAQVKRVEFFPPGEQGYLTAYAWDSEIFRWFSPWIGYAKYSHPR